MDATAYNHFLMRSFRGSVICEMKPSRFFATVSFGGHGCKLAWLVFLRLSVYLFFLLHLQKFYASSVDGLPVIRSVGSMTSSGE